MADNLLAGEFWLPQEFFTDDKYPLSSQQQKPINSNLTSPFDISANFGSSISSSAFSSPVELVPGSTETESEKEEESLYRLTNYFPRLANQSQRSWPMSMVKMNGGDDLFYTAVAGQVDRMKMNGGDEGVLKGRGYFGRPIGPLYGNQCSPQRNNLSRSFYCHQLGLPFTFEPERHDQNLNQNNCCSILGRPSVEDLLHRQLQLQQQMLSLHRTKVLGQIQFEENAKYISSSLGLPQYAKPSPFVQHQINQMRGACLGRVSSKQGRAGTGVFIPRPSPSNAPNKPVAGRYTAHFPSRVYQAVNNLSLSSTKAWTTSDNDTWSVRPKTILIQKTPGLQLDGPPDGLVEHRPCLPQEWSY